MTTSELGRVSLTTCEMDTGKSSLLRMYPYRIAPGLKEALHAAKVRSLLQAGIIAPSFSPWSSPMVPVQKTDGTIWLCIDLRHLNRVSDAHGGKFIGGTGRGSVDV